MADIRKDQERDDLHRAIWTLPTNLLYNIQNGETA